MLFRQITHDDLGCASYLIGDERAGVAAVVDPRLDIAEYLRLARFLGVQIEHVLETHNHADHVSGHAALAAATGATIHVHRDARPDYDHEPFDDGWELELGDLRVRALHTPGHRPEHTAFALIETDRSDEPWAVLTGDSLFVGDVARPDLAIESREGAHTLFRSLHGRLLKLPRETEVWPGHLGGSMCGGPGMDLKPSSTIGFELDNNPLLGADEDGFVEELLAGLGPQPPNFQNIVAHNRGPLSGVEAQPRPVTPSQLEQLREQGALVVDVRSDAQYDDAHVPGAVSVSALHAGFGTRLAWLAEADRRFAIVGRDDEDGIAALRLAAAVRIDRFAGYLAGGMTTWRDEHRPVERFERLTVAALHERWEGDGELQLVDVREVSEWRDGHIPGALHRPYHDVVAGPPDGFDPERPAAVLCASGQRAAVATGLLRNHGAREVLHVVGGGVPLWQRSGWPVEPG